MRACIGLENARFSGLYHTPPLIQPGRRNGENGCVTKASAFNQVASVPRPAWQAQASGSAWRDSLRTAAAWPSRIVTAALVAGLALLPLTGEVLAQTSAPESVTTVPSAKPDPQSPEVTGLPNPLDDPASAGFVEAPLPAMVSGAAPAAAPSASFNDTLVPYAPSSLPGSRGEPDEMNKGAVYLVARLTDGGAQINDGLVWRVYSETPKEDGHLELVATAMGGDAEFRLDPGAYLINTAYGHAGVTNRLVVGRGVYSKAVVLNAGGVKLDAGLSADDPLPPDEIRFDVYGMDYNTEGERTLIVGGVKPDAIIRLGAGTYHVASRYGEVNAVVRADITVDPGKLTSVTLFHEAAEVTLKLVNDTGGEAIANTGWTVLTPGGDIVVEETGAFPNFVLAAGEYEVIARNNGVNYSRNFTVVSGENREVEVLARTQGTSN